MLKLFGALVILGLALACITSWVLDRYDTTWHPKRSVQHPAAGDGDGTKGRSPPFPGGELNNIFWFIQVRPVGDCDLAVFGANITMRQRFVFSL